MAGQGPKSLWKNEYFRTILTIIVVIAVVVGFWYGLRWGLNTNYPVLAVASGSMSVPQPDPGWASPFSRTLSVWVSAKSFAVWRQKGKVWL